MQSPASALPGGATVAQPPASAPSAGPVSALSRPCPLQPADTAAGDFLAPPPSLKKEQVITAIGEVTDLAMFLDVAEQCVAEQHPLGP